MRKIKNDEIEDWEDTRLTIVNEISFASQGAFETMCKNLQKLKKQRCKLCGECDQHDIPQRLLTAGASEARSDLHEG